VARFLFSVFGSSGHIHPMLPVAKILADQGHEVGFLTAPSYKALLEQMGFSYWAPRFWNAKVASLGMPIRSRNFVRSLREAIKYILEFSLPQGVEQAKDLECCKREWNFDVLVSSDMVLGASLFAERSNCIWATLGAFLSCPLPGPAIPPWSLGLRPPKNLLGRLGVGVFSFLYRQSFRLLSIRWNKIRRNHGLPSKSISLMYSIFSPYLYLLPSPSLFDYSRSDLPPSIHHVGPCMWEEASSSTGSWVSPFDNDNPTLYCTAGTVYNSLDFVRVIVDAVRDKKVNVFATVGRNNDPVSLGTLPKNVQVVQYVPQNVVLPRVSAVICNGGSGATMGAILARKPMVIVPMISDQPENARRCEDLGLAKVLSLKKFNAENVWLAIRSVLEDARFQARATAVGDQFAALNGPRQGAFLLDQLARTRRPVLRSGNDGTSAAVERLGL